MLGLGFKKKFKLLLCCSGFLPEIKQQTNQRIFVLYYVKLIIKLDSQWAVYQVNGAKANAVGCNNSAINLSSLLL